MARIVTHRSHAAPRSRWALACALALLGPLACSDDRVLLPGAASSTGEPSSGSTTTSGSSSTSATSSTTGLDDTTGPASSGEPEVIFVPPPDVGANDECSIFTQNCPPDQKCMPWANDGGGAWNAWGCKPLADDPVGIDEVCHVEGTGTSGIDDCERGAMCWDVDPKTNQGVCVPLCVGGESYEDVTCEDPQRMCAVAGDAVIRLCLPVCDPLDQDCPEGQACYPINDGWRWQCAPDASGAAGANGDPCDFINECDPGLVCLWDSGVCSEVCDLDDPLGDMQCAGAAEGQVCLPWYEDGDAPPSYEDLGVCTLP